MQEVRETKGRKVSDGKWVEGVLIKGIFKKRKDNSDIYYILNFNDLDYDSFEDLDDDYGYYEIIPETACQYTGIKDYSGEKIYENDMVYYDGNMSYGTVEWDKEGAMFVVNFSGKKMSFSRMQLPLLEVVCNKFDS